MYLISSYTNKFIQMWTKEESISLSFNTDTLTEKKYLSSPQAENRFIFQ